MGRSDANKCLFIMLTVFVSGSLLFLMGFFPASQHLIEPHDKNSAATTKPMLLDNIHLNVPEPKYKQVILMIIDAWRLDFVNASNMPVATNAACHQLTLEVDIPTVTMPRLKSLMSGTISNFIDVVLNLGHTQHLKDSVLHRLLAKNKSAVFAGDNTWMKLFPEEFLRKQSNQDSFFVNDFYKGDTNVTNTLKKELLFKDWHLLVLHYLGLDHIGHVEGSSSSKILKKLLEMDEVIKHIIQNKDFENHLLLITGDHGMRNGGGHGGGDKEEIYIPLLLLQQNCTTKRKINNFGMASWTHNQIDLAPTLSALLGVDIPNSSLGNLIPELLEQYTPKEQLYFYLYNAKHLMDKAFAKFSNSYIWRQDYFKWYLEARKAHRQFLLDNTFNTLSFEKAKQNYIRSAKELSRILSATLVKFEYDLIVIALILTTLSALTILINTLWESSGSHGLSFSKHIATCESFMYQNYKLSKVLAFYLPSAIVNYVAHCLHWIKYRGFLCAFLLTIPITLNMYLSMDALKLLRQIILPLNRRFRFHFKLTIPPLLLTLFLFHSFSLISTSFIEEEHQTWYYLTPTLLIYLTIQNFYQNMKQVWRREYLTSENFGDNTHTVNITNVFVTVCQQLWEIRYCFAVMCTLIFCKRLNQGGSKWYHLVDLGDILNSRKNSEYLHFLLLFALMFLWCVLRKHNTPGQMLTCTTALICIFCYRQSPDKPGVTLIIFWISVVLTFLLQYREFICDRCFSWSIKYTLNGPSHFNLLQALKTNLSCCLTVCALLHKPHNVILLPIMVFILETTYSLCDNLYIKNRRSYNRCYVLILKTVLTIFVANMFYFYQGNTNKLSTIDLNPGYIGLGSYNPIIVGTLITLNMYSAQINAFLCLMCHLFTTQMKYLPLREDKECYTNSQLFECTEEDLYLVLNVFTVSTVMPTALYWCILTNFRYHLFIYSVFAPKAIYECFHILVFYFNFILTILYFKIFK